MSKTTRTSALFLLCILAIAGNARAEEAKPPQGCDIADRACILKELEKNAGQIDTASWRDQTYRELAKTLAFEGDTDAAIALISKIETPDTQAMTIRGIGMAVAAKKLPPAALRPVFDKLRGAAQAIPHPPSLAIALTYIAMAEAFAGDDEAAWKTAGDMENEALRHKAYAETAEIQAERGDFAAAMKSIGFITTASFRNKAYANVSKILADRKMLAEALKAAEAVANPYKKAAALQYVLDAQKPREAVSSPHEKME